MLDYVDYTIDGDGYQGNGNGNGYNHLNGDWGLFYKVAKRFTYKIVREDREDFLHDLFLAFARVKASYNAKGKAQVLNPLQFLFFLLFNFYHENIGSFFYLTIVPFVG